MYKYKKGIKNNKKKNKYKSNRRNRNKRKKNRNKNRKNTKKRVYRNRKNKNDKSIAHGDMSEVDVEQIINQIVCTREFHDIAFYISVEMLEGIIRSDGMIRRFKHRMKQDPAFVAFLRSLLKKSQETNRNIEGDVKQEVEDSDEDVDDEPEEQKDVKFGYDHYYT